MATGGTGEYSWLESQYYTYAVDVEFADGRTLGFTKSGPDGLLPSQAMDGGSIMAYADAPGLPVNLAVGEVAGRVVSGTYTATFTLNVFVTSGTQIVACPPIVWNVTINIQNGIGSGSGALGFLIP
jgi:hypothetical protein